MRPKVRLKIFDFAILARGVALPCSPKQNRASVRKVAPHRTHQLSR